MRRAYKGWIWTTKAHEALCGGTGSANKSRLFMVINQVGGPAWLSYTCGTSAYGFLFPWRGDTTCFWHAGFVRLQG